MARGLYEMLLIMQPILGLGKLEEEERNQIRQHCSATQRTVTTTQPTASNANRVAGAAHHNALPIRVRCVRVKSLDAHRSTTNIQANVTIK